MSVLKCHECGTEFGVAAMTCPKCGVKTKRPPTQGERMFLAMAFLLFLAPFFPWGMFADNASSPKAVSEAPQGGEDTPDKNTEKPKADKEAE